MITMTRREFFTAYHATPCASCEARDKPGTGVGPVIGGILMECYVNAEIERLERLKSLDAKPDGYDAVLRQRNHEMYIRACWLTNVIPDAEKLPFPAPIAQAA
ncbi:hypothetical protein [Erythrobacter aureus]|uniref:Uncharacterized protein n=1 Tax=Erythrobacter aureus TaxID=2182384 RepID=A0A345YIZ4_9SPHN|nr:hypothetical protein [Erythrobacter aureus]AXK43896.1 hypothetical protein DVR09_15695 [Erythrobacter aureus]